MTTWLLAVVAILGSSAQNPDTALWKAAYKMAMRVKGRVLSGLVREGMTIEEVEQILGMSNFVTNWTTGAGTLVGLNYDALGISVSLIHRRNDDARLRVHRVTFKPLFSTKERLLTQDATEEAILRALR